LARDDLEAMREEFGAGEQDDGGLPFGLDDDLHQMRLAEQTGLNLERWASCSGFLTICGSKRCADRGILYLRLRTGQSKAIAKLEVGSIE
jgi:hypothetical protein